MNKFLVTGIALILILAACKEQANLIESASRLADMQRMLDVQKELTVNSQVPIWDIFNTQLTSDESQALGFLYAYMPLSDLADYSPEFFLANVRQCLKARYEMPWGKEVPEDIFLHFVLPLRVNNENLDSFRMVMYNELRERVRGLGMAHAALEINHWCHEKVNYRPTDSRTGAPLSTVKKTFGRCGEESTFTVSAMRTVGIPARQVYTPRWAHTDDNHAWVEVWIEGKWHYLGACEPEPELNMGWFSEPSRRTMLVHTRAYGRYYGSEEVVTEADRFSELNLTANYAPVKTIVLLIKKTDGSPADSARIEFGLYNYAEFYPIATKYSNNRGIAQLTTGLGDLLVWASLDGRFSYRKLSVSETDTLVLVLSKSSQPDQQEMYDMIPPHAIQVDSRVSADQRKENDRRLALEDSIRNAYMMTFKDSTWSSELAQKLNLDMDTVQGFIAKSYGNWNEITAYLEKNKQAHRNNLLALAGQLSDKDYSDVTEEILSDHLRHTYDAKGVDRQEFIRYVLSPRIDLENLSPWRSFLREKMKPLEDPVKTDVSVLVQWINENIKTDELANRHSRAPLTPVGVFNLRVADLKSRDIFFVAACRTFGIPARLNPVSRIPEYFRNGKWLRAAFSNAPDVKVLQGFLQLNHNNDRVTPRYYTHFTLGVLEDGHYKTLDFEEGLQVSDFNNIPLDTGRYLLITGNRKEDGSVLSSITYFTIKSGKTTRLLVELRENTGQLKSFGKLNLDKLQIYSQKDPQPVNLHSLTQGKNLVIVLLDPGLEPSRHVLNDLGPYAEHLNRWGSRFVFLTPAEKNTPGNTFNAYTLPANHITGVDLNNNIRIAAESLYDDDLAEKLPIVMLCDDQGNVNLLSVGYKIGIGEQLLKLAR